MILGLSKGLERRSGGFETRPCQRINRPSSDGNLLGLPFSFFYFDVGVADFRARHAVPLHWDVGVADRGSAPTKEF